MGGICPCELNKRLSGQLSSQIRELVHVGRHSPPTPPVDGFVPSMGLVRADRPQPDGRPFTPVDRMNAPPDGFRLKRENLSAPTANRHPRRRSDGSGSDHGDHARGGRRAPFAFVHRGQVVSHPIRIFSETEVLRTGENARITCNTYSVPYKGKDPKKRLSPKQVNTLIHSYVTFYIFLIFQYLSLWKSVFSHN